MGRTLVSIPVIALLSALLLSACGTARIAKADRPIKGHSACVFCHRTNDPSADGLSQAFAGGIEPSAACLDCHHYAVNHHPVNVAPKKTSAAALQTGLPLFDGQIRCLTCHQAHADASHNRLRGASKLLRGGPYPDQRAICMLTGTARTTSTPGRWSIPRAAGSGWSMSRPCRRSIARQGR